MDKVNAISGSHFAQLGQALRNVGSLRTTCCAATSITWKLVIPFVTNILIRPLRRKTKPDSNLPLKSLSVALVQWLGSLQHSAKRYRGRGGMIRHGRFPLACRIGLTESTTFLKSGVAITLPPPPGRGERMYHQTVRTLQSYSISDKVEDKCLTVRRFFSDCLPEVFYILFRWCPSWDSNTLKDESRPLYISMRVPTCKGTILCTGLWGRRSEPQT